MGRSPALRSEDTLLSDAGAHDLNDLDNEPERPDACIISNGFAPIRIVCDFLPQPGCRKGKT